MHVLPYDIHRLTCNALHELFYYWRPFCDLLARCGVPPEIVKRAEHEWRGQFGTKRAVAGAVLDELARRGAAGERVTLELLKTLQKWSDFSEAKADPGTARAALVALQDALRSHRLVARQERELAEGEAAAARQPTIDRQRALGELSGHFHTMLRSDDA